MANVFTRPLQKKGYPYPCMISNLQCSQVSKRPEELLAYFFTLQCIFMKIQTQQVGKLLEDGSGKRRYFVSKQRPAGHKEGHTYVQGVSL